MRNFFCWVLVVWCCCLLVACSAAKSPDILSQVSGVWTEGTANSMIYLNLAGHQKTFAMAAAPGIIYPADVTAIDQENHILTVNVSFPGAGSDTYTVKPYVFRQVPAGENGQFRLVMTMPTGRQATLSFVRRLSSAELAAQPTQFAIATGETQVPPATSAPTVAQGPAPVQTPPAGQASANAPTPPARRTPPATPVAPPVIAAAPATALPPPHPASKPASPTRHPHHAPARPVPPAVPQHLAKHPATPAPRPVSRSKAPTPPPKQSMPPKPATHHRSTPKPAALAGVGGGHVARPAARPGKQPPKQRAAAQPTQAQTAGGAPVPGSCSQGAPAARHACATRTFQSVDRSLNARYRQVIAGLSGSQQKALAQEEVQWIIRKRARCQAQANRAPGGDLQRRTAQLQCWTQMTRQRLGELSRRR